MPVRPVPVWSPGSETFSHRASRWSLTATLCPVLQMTAGSERARGLRAVIQGMAGLPPGLRAPCRPVTSVPICLVWTHPLLAPGSPPASALHLPRGPLTSLAPLPQCTPTAIRRPVAQVLTPSLGWSPPCGGQTEDSGQAVCAASFLGRPPESPGQVRGRGPRYSACRTAGKGVSGGQLSGSARPCPGLCTECVLSRAPWGGGHPEPTRPSLLASAVQLLLRLPHFPGVVSVRPSVRPPPRQSSLAGLYKAPSAGWGGGHPESSPRLWSSAVGVGASHPLVLLRCKL